MKGQEGRVILYLLLIAVILGGLVLVYFQRNLYSKDTVRLEILGPSGARAGKEVTYTVKYKNNGSARLEDVELVFQYPDQSIPVGEEGRRVVLSVEDLYPGEEETVEFGARLFGRKGETLTFDSTLSYRPKELKAVYESESSFTTEMSGPSLNLVLDMPSRVVPKKEFELSLNYYSDLDWALSGLGVRLEYPGRFELIDSAPETKGGDEWRIPVLTKAEGGRVRVRGRLEGEPNQRHSFKAQLGVWIEDRFVPVEEESRVVETVEPELVVSQQVNGFSDRPVGPGDLLHYEIFFRNVGDTRFEDMFLVSELSGPFDWESVRTRNGRVTLSDRSIVWDWKENPRLRYLGPGQEGRVEFWVSVREGNELIGMKHPLLVNNTSLMNMEEVFETKVSSALLLTQKGYYENDIFQNTGPVPPKVGERTTYTVIWRVENLNNDLENVKVRAVLPAGVKPTGEVSPADRQGEFAFDSDSREILWDMGKMAVGSEEESVRTLSFQVELTPQSGQRGLVVPLIEEAVLTADDTWTERRIKRSAPSVDTSLPDDGSVEEQDGVVR